MAILLRTIRSECIQWVHTSYYTTLYKTKIVALCSVLSFKLNIDPGENNIKITYRVLNINILFYTQQDKLSFV